MLLGRSFCLGVLACAALPGFAGPAGAAAHEELSTHKGSKSMKLLFVGDLHTGPVANEKEEAVGTKLLERAKDADLVILGGDMTNAGRPEEYDRLLALYAAVKGKCVPVRGNHDMGAYLSRLRDWIPADAEINFEPGKYPVWVWTTDWFQMLDANTKCFNTQQALPEPYNRIAQAPVIVAQDGIGPYYFFERAGYRFIVLDASTHRLGEQQQAWLAATIQSSRLPILILMHHNILPTGSIYDGAMLWDRLPLLQVLFSDPRVLGVFSAHVHYNRTWDWQGKKIVTTAERGASRFIELKDGKIAAVEPLANENAGGRPRDAAKHIADDLPLDLRYWWADGVLADNTFWCFDRAFWDQWGPGHWGWHNPKGPGGLAWTVPPELLPARETWFGVNFRSTTPWQLLLERDGRESVVASGGPGDNLIATGSFGRGDKRPSRVILRQQAPACGHASVYLVLDVAPVSQFNRYP